MRRILLLAFIFALSAGPACARAHAGVGYTFSPSAPTTADTVTFTATNNTNTGTPDCGPKTPCKFEWYEGATKFQALTTALTATRAFSTAGAKSVTVKLYNRDGAYKGEATRSFSVSVAPTPTPTPTPTATPSPTPTATPSPTPTATPSPTPTATPSPTPTPTPDPTPTRVAYDTTAPSTPGTANAMFPRPIDYCSSTILLNTWEPAHGNTGYMGAGDSYGTMGWGDGDARFAWWSSFSRWTTRRAQINGHYSNGSTDHALTTTEAFSFAACRWGVREDLLRAVAVQESDWHETTVGDLCASPNTVDTGHGSFGITQVKNLNCADDGDWGGWPRTAQSIPFNVDTYGAAFRACLEQDFWSTIPVADSDARRERGCVGEWFSGSYDPDSSYVTSVYTWLANRTWLTY